MNKPTITQLFINELQAKEFSGDCLIDKGTRLVNATDNSVYQILPQAVIAPRTTEDIQLIFCIANHAPFSEITFTARGGGTGTNGQALNTGIIIDCSKHMNHIVELNLQQGYVRIQPGVVLDQLNEFLHPHGVFFAPSISPSNRATLGGMANTDACGQGSLFYGKTSDHVIAITAIYSDGTRHTSKAIDQQQLACIKQQTGIIGAIYRQVDAIVLNCQHDIKKQFPKLTRFMTGYNLAHVYRNKQFNLNAILTGSEGTLAVITELELKLSPIPKSKTLLVVEYNNFHKALLHAQALLALHPIAIETIDETILTLAKTDLIYEKVKAFISHDTQAINLVEFIGKQPDHLETLLKNNSAYHIITDPNDMNHLWDLRKKSVGLLGKLSGKRKPVSGVEDTVVPPENLADYITEFRALLDSKGLTYGMFGHVDAGCLHVRPALDMQDPADVILYNEISDAVAHLTKKYQGIMWGEHGKGYRSEYTPMFFGKKLYGQLRKIKQCFDPGNKLNPGKIAVPIESQASLVSLSQSKKRGDLDRQITFNSKIDIRCNGNGACFNYQADDVMCPSYKVTRDRRQSPKGRSDLLREWLRQQSIKHYSPNKLVNSIKKLFCTNDFSNEVFDSLHGCLGCNACHIECPVNVNIPEMKAQFLQHHYRQYFRPLRDIVIKNIERLSGIQARFPRFWNSILTNKLIKWVLSTCLQLADLPLLSTHSHQLPTYSIEHLRQHNDNDKFIIIVQDWLTTHYNTKLLNTYVQFIEHLGFKPCLLNLFENGKAMHAKGYLQEFKQLVDKNTGLLNKIAALNIPMIGIEPSITLSYRQEYREYSNEINFNVMFIQEWLNSISLPKTVHLKKKVQLFLHCSEQKTQDGTWLKAMKKFGIDVQIIKTGCCGMAGVYGYEREHQSNSKKLFDMSWRQPVQSNQDILVTGFSCQQQVIRFTNKKVKHPIEFLLASLQDST